MEKLGNSTSCEVQSEMLVLVENFLRHTEASDLEALLNALAQLFPELLRVDTHSERKACQEQLNWNDASGFLLEALIAKPASREEEVALQAFHVACSIDHVSQTFCNVQQALMHTLNILHMLLQDILRSLLQWPTQSFFTCGGTHCRTSKKLGLLQPGWVLQLPVSGRMPLDAALEQSEDMQHWAGGQAGRLLTCMRHD